MFDFFCCVELEPEKVFIYKSTCEMHNPLNVTYMSEAYREFKLIDRKYCSYGVRMYYRAYIETQKIRFFTNVRVHCHYVPVYWRCSGTEIPNLLGPKDTMKIY